MSELKSALDPDFHAAPIGSALRIERSTLLSHLLRERHHAVGLCLDVGCGSKPYELLFRPFVTRFVGLDLDGEGMDVCGDAMVLPFRTGSFDTVLSTQVLEHLREPATHLREIGRVLRPGGKLILTAPQTWGLHEEPRDFFRFTRYGLRHLVEEAGLELIDLQQRGGTIATIGQMLSLLTEELRLPRLLGWPLRACVNALALAGDRFIRLKGNPLGYTLVARALEQE